MRYLCTNRACSLFARLIAGSGQICEACGQRVLDEKVMLKRGMDVQALMAAKGRVVTAPALAPTNSAKREEKNDVPHQRHPKRTWTQIKADLPREILIRELETKTKRDITLAHGIGMLTMNKLMAEYGIENPRSQRSGKQEQGTPKASAVTPSDGPVPPATEPPAGAVTGLKIPEDHKPNGFRFQANRTGGAAHVVSADVEALVSATKHLQFDGRYNLTIVLEEVVPLTEATVR